MVVRGGRAEDAVANDSVGRADYRCPPASPTATLAEALAAEGQSEFLHAHTPARSASRNGLRKCTLSESAGMLFAPNSHVHDPGKCVHAAMRVLLGAAW